MNFCEMGSKIAKHLGVAARFEDEDEDENENDNREPRTANRELRTPTRTPRSFLDNRFLGNPAALALAVSRLETEGGF
jgi:hypothetical protein